MEEMSLKMRSLIFIDGVVVPTNSIFCMLEAPPTTSMEVEHLELVPMFPSPNLLLDLSRVFASSWWKNSEVHFKAAFGAGATEPGHGSLDFHHFESTLRTLHLLCMMHANHAQMHHTPHTMLEHHCLTKGITSAAHMCGLTLKLTHDNSSLS